MEHELRTGFPAVRVHQVLVAVAFMALAAFLVTLQRDPTGPPLPELWLTPGDAAQRDRIETYREYLVKVVSDQQSPEAWTAIGEFYAAFGRLDSANACFQRAADLGATGPEFHFRWGITLDIASRPEPAIEQFAEARRQGKKDWVQKCWYMTGMCHLKREDAAAAEDAFGRIRKWPPATYQLAKLLIRAGRNEEATELIEILQNRNPQALETFELVRRQARAGFGELPPGFEEREDQAHHELQNWLPTTTVEDFRREHGFG